MKLIGKSIKDLVLRSELASLISDRFYNAIAPQARSYPLAIGRVTGVVPVDYKMNPGTGLACTDTMYYRVSVFSKDPEQAAVIAQKMRKVLDRPRPGKYKDIQLNTARMINAEESAFAEDETDIFTWDLDFEIRVDFTTEDI